MKNGKATLGFHIYKTWQIFKRFAGTFRQAQTLKLGGVHTHTHTLNIKASLKMLQKMRHTV